jgi:hypothetical protein
MRQRGRAYDDVPHLGRRKASLERAAFSPRILSLLYELVERLKERSVTGYLALIEALSHPKTNPSSTSLPDAFAHCFGFGQTDALLDLLRQRAR